MFKNLLSIVFIAAIGILTACTDDFVEQLEGADVSVYHYKVVFKPTAIIPDFDVK